jgi:excinuclease UvrABC nuclease subunit
MALINPEQQAPTEEGSSQDDYEKTVAAALSVLTESSDQVVQMLQQQEDPATALGETTALLIANIDEQSGGQIPEDVILPAAEEVLGNISELAEQAQVFEITEEVVQKAGDILELELAEIYGVDPEEAQAYAEENIPEEERMAMTSRFEAQDGAA